jgi:hypothetical protein
MLILNDDNLRKRRTTKFGPHIHLEPFPEVPSKNSEHDSITCGSEEILSGGYDTKYTKGYNKKNDSISSFNQIDNIMQDLHLEKLGPTILLTILSEDSFTKIIRVQ